MRGFIVVLGVALEASAALGAASGRVVAADGKPVTTAEVCNVVKEATSGCVPVNAEGYYHLDAPEGKSVFVRATGYRPLRIAAVEQSAPVVLHRAATLLVKIVDAASHKPIAKGTVTLNYASGKRVGSAVPFNPAGVRIASLEPGDVLARAEAEGYEPGGPLPVTLHEGIEATVTLEMRKRGQQPK
jgi:hypothetical protein